MITKRTHRTRPYFVALVACLGLATAASPALAHEGMQAQPQDTSATEHHVNGVNGTFSRVEVPAGTVIQARMNSAVTTRRSRAGTPFFASVTAPILDGNGKVLIPENTQVLGRVEGSVKGGVLFLGPRLGISLQAMNINGRYIPISAAMTSVPVDHYRAPLLITRQARLPTGSVIQARLQAPVTVGVRWTPAPQRATGGGPASPANRANCPASCR